MKLQHIAGLLFILISLSWGCSQNTAEETEVNSSEQVQEKAPVPALEKKLTTPIEVDAAVNVDATGGSEATDGPDQYGRLPGDEHYGHAHAPKDEQPGNPVVAPSGAPFATGAAPTDGPDKFGRNPGDEHYGHDHE